MDDDVENDGGNRERKTPSSSSKVFIYIKAVSANKKTQKKVRSAPRDKTALLVKRTMNVL